ncbi:MAG: hypothetical protein LPK25_13495 [Cyclobacteriaceae bacterium]|nr:hypothetical protein [Cyclobacteriaceae bacterium]MDX5467525.1 hypothetical protein [Cyclobacteriaceae bacterium]
MKTYRINTLGILTFARFQGVMGLLIGFLLGVIYSVGGFILDTLATFGLVNSPQTLGLDLGTILAFGAIIGMPILFSILGFLLGLAEAYLFNWVAHLFGGFNLKFQVRE